MKNRPRRKALRPNPIGLRHCSRCEKKVGDWRICPFCHYTYCSACYHGHFTYCHTLVKKELNRKDK